MFNLIKNIPKLSNVIPTLLRHNNKLVPFVAQTKPISYQSTDLWKSVLSVSTQGSKKGRGKRRGGSKSKDLNLGQNIGDGKLQVSWPGLNTNILNRNAVSRMKIVGEDVDREKKLTEIRNQMDKFKKISVSPHDRGFTSSSLNGKSIGPPLSYDDVDFSGFDTRIIEYKVMIAHKSILGKKKTSSCFVVTGNKNGVFGYGLGKGPTSQGAMKLAKTHASQKLLYVDRYEDRTIFHNFYEEYYFTKVYAEKKPQGYGLVCHRIIKKICELIGIKDIYVKVEGSRNPKNISKAFISGLLNQQKYIDIAAKKKLHVVEFKPETDFVPTVLASPDGPTIKDSNEKSNNHSYETDLNLYLFGNRVRAEKKMKVPFYNEYESYKNYCKRKNKEAAQKKAKVERVKLLSSSLENNIYPHKKSPAAQAASEA